MTNEEHKTLTQMAAALREIRDEAATKPNGGAWAAGVANLCLATLPMITYITTTIDDRTAHFPPVNFDDLPEGPRDLGGFNCAGEYRWPKKDE